MFQRFEQVVERHHDYARQWKERKGGKVLGFFCTYVPEELLYAAHILPVRIIGALQPQDVSEAHISSMYCPFCRDCLAQGLLGRYDYLDGVVMARSCMHMLQAYRSWTTHIPVSYHHFVGIPSMVSLPSAKDFLLAELQDFKRSLEEWLGRSITNADLDRGIEVLNRDRRLLRQLYELRKPHPPRLSGKEAALVALSSMLADKEEHARWLEEVLPELEAHQDGPRAGVRLMVVGSENHDVELYEIIEGAGANVVMEEFCMGSRYFWNQTLPQSDRLAAIAARYLERPRCPLKDVNERQRLAHILNLVREWQVQGVLLIQQKFCDPHEFDLPVINRFLQQNGIPTYFLELDVTVHRGAVRTRTEAFLEMLELEAV